jgi:O-antigen ligase
MLGAAGAPVGEARTQPFTMIPADGRDERRPGWLALTGAALLAAAILFGGGAAEGQFNNGILLGGAGGLLFALVAAHLTGMRPLPSSAAIPVLLLAAFLLIGTFQLLPLDPAGWRGLPGRDLAASALQLVGSAGAPRPLSLDPEATRRSLAALLLPAAILLTVLGANRREIVLLLVTAIGCALISAVIGALQLGLSYPAWLTYYEGGNGGATSGVFANVNHHAALLLAAIVCVGIAVRLRASAAPFAAPARSIDPAWLLLPLYMVIIFAPGSRAALLLLVLAVPASAIVGFGRTSVKLLAFSLLGVALVVFLLSEITPAGTNVAVGQSFLFSDDQRYAILPDVLYSLRQYWPAGSGLGTFTQVFAVNENLDIAGHEYVNHAHNDVLELLIETGIAGLVVAAAAVVAVIARVVTVQVRDPRGRGGHGPLLWGGFFILALLALHSLADYPLRTPAIAAIAGLAAGLVFLPERMPQRRPRRGAVAVIVGAAAIGLLVGAEVFRMYAAQAAVRGGHGAAAMRLDPSNGAALALAAQEQLVAHRNREARALASEAIRRLPLSPNAMRVLAMANDLDGRSGVAAWRLASAMGWRDPATQFWAMQQALLNREYGTAAIRADALLRTSADRNGERVAAVRALATSAPFRSELIRRLSLQPRWESAFFDVSTRDGVQQVAGVAATLMDLARSGTEVTPRQARATIQALIDRKQYAAALALDRKVVRTASPDAAGSLDFDQPTDHYVFEVTPFDWNVVDSAGTIVSVEQSENHRVLILGTDGRRPYRPVWRYVALAPGEYRLGYAMRGSPGSPAALGLSVTCAGKPTPLASSSTEPLEGSDFVRRALEFAIPGDCPLALIAFEAKPGDGPADAQFADLSLGSV